MFPSQLQVFLAPGPTDMRKQINGLSILVESQMTLNPFSGYLFGFCNRSRTMVKLLYWDLNGFCLWMKRLEKGRFQWPTSSENKLKINQRELSWLLDGLNIVQKRAHPELHFKSVI